ncbi:MAG TPA: UbiD family decarboxylase [Xanthobacteraceae bacterium]|nr:UbiD family decarboxylase [Xanthobacteraceae bacterium]
MNERVPPALTPAADRKTVTDLRHWLDILAGSGRLAVARPGVKLRFELAAIAKTLDGRQATLFPQPDGHPVPVISGLTSDRGWMAEAMGVGNDGLLATFQEAALNPLPWREVASAPVQEVVHRDVDLPRLLPIPVHNELDSAPYITAGLLVSRNPKSDAQNVTIHRLQLSGRNRLGVLLLPRHTLRFFQMAETDGADLPIAIAIGVDPLTLLASQAIAPLDFDELTIAGALHGRPLEVVKCLTSDVRVPANAEIVLEGRILARVREMEGPFGEFPQYYSEPAEQHVIEIDAVTHRKQPIFHTILGGGIEHLLLGGIPREATIMAHLKRSFPGVRDVHLSRGGTCRYHLNVQLEKRFEGEGKNVIMGAFGAHYDIKHVVVVDTDVDIHDQTQVEWAIATRFQADRDTIIVSEAQGSRLDPSSRNGVSAKMGFDATIPLDSPALKYKRIAVPGEEAVDLAKAIDERADWRKAVT